MKVLVVHNRYRTEEPSGEDRVVDQETAALEQAGHDVVRYERHSDDIADFTTLKKAAVPASVVWNPFAGHAFGLALDRLQPDVVHVHNLFPLLSPSVLRACHRRRVPVVATLHNFRQICVSGTYFRSGSSCYECVGNKGIPAIRHGCYRGSALTSGPMVMANVVQKSTWRTVPSAYVFISDAERTLFQSLQLPPSRCFVKWHLVPPATATSQTSAENLVVFTGRLSEAKGVRFLMRAWDRFAAGPVQRDMRLAIAGAGELEGEVRAWAATRPSVDFLGLLSRQECAGLLARARAAVVPSVWPETFGLVVAEAKAAGVPPIAPAHGSFPELISDGVDGLLFTPGDADALADTLVRVESSPALSRQLGNAAREAARNQFDPSDNMAQLQSIYRFAMEHPTWRNPGDVTTSGLTRSAPPAAPLEPDSSVVGS